MNHVVIFITAAHVLLHSVFGCCGHAFTAWTDRDGGHACEHSVVACAGDHAHRHVHSAAENEHAERVALDGVTAGEPVAPCEGRACPHESCSWVAGTDGAVPPSVFAMHWLPLEVPALSCVTSLESHAEILDRLDAAKIPAPPVRLHLAVGVLLI